MFVVDGERVAYAEQATLAEVMGGVRDAYEAVLVTGDDGVALRIPRADLADAAVAVDDVGLHVRYRGDDIVGTRRIRVALDTGVEPHVEGFADPRRVAAGEPVTFTAQVSGFGGATPDVRWTFGDDAPRGKGATVRHTFTEADTYDVVVGASTPTDRVGATDIVTVVVTEPDPEPTPTATPTPGAGPGTGTGTGTGTGQVGAERAFRAPMRARNARSAPAEPVVTATATPTPTPTATPSAAPFGERVEGELLAAPAVPSGGAAGEPPPAPETSATDEDGPALRVPGWVPGGGLLLGVLWTGFRLDMRRARPRWSA